MELLQIYRAADSSVKTTKTKLLDCLSLYSSLTVSLFPDCFQTASSDSQSEILLNTVHGLSFINVSKLFFSA